MYFIPGHLVGALDLLTPARLHARMRRYGVGSNGTRTGVDLKACFAFLMPKDAPSKEKAQRRTTGLSKPSRKISEGEKSNQFAP